MTTLSLRSITVLGLLSLIGAGCLTQPQAPIAPASPIIEVPTAVSSTPSMEVSTTTETASSTTAEPSAQNTTFKTVTYNTTSDRATVHVSYPQLVGSYSSDVIANFNAAVSSSVNGFVHDFEQNAANMDERTRALNPKPWSLNMDAAVQLRSPELLVVFGEGSIFSGGEQSSSFYVNVIFDVRFGKALTVKDLFLDPNQAVRVLSDRSIGKLKLLRPDVSATNIAKITDGAGPEWTNFSFIYPTRTGLTVIFPEKQVAAADYGEHTIRFTYAELSSIIKPRFATIKEDVLLWDTYMDDANGFNFKLPADLGNYNGQHVDYRFGVNTVTLPNSTISNGCYLNPAFAPAPDSVVDTKKINNMTFCHSTNAERGMSQLYRNDYFTVVTGTHAVTFGFTAHYIPEPQGVIGICEGGKSTDEQCQLFDEKADTAIYQKILQTVNFGQIK